MSTTLQPRKKAIVVGAGIGGLSTAARLAHAGLDVVVYEKNSHSGGRCSLIHHEGYRFDQGPSLLLLPQLFHQLYNDLGEKLEDHITLLQCHPNYNIHYHDGQKVVLSSDRAELEQEMIKWEGSEGPAALEGFMREAGIHGQLSYDQILSKTFNTVFSMLRPKFAANVINTHAFGSLYGRTARWFKTERMRRAFSFGSMYLGSSPFDAPGTYTLLQWTETAQGIHYPIGGFHAVPASVHRIAEKNGAVFHFNTGVQQVTYNSSGAANGVILEDGTKVESDIVVVNADVVWAHNNLFLKQGEEKMIEKGVKGRKDEELLNAKYAKKLLNKEHSCSSISFYWAMDRKLPELTTHNIFLAEDYKGSFDDIFKDKSMPKEPSFYVNVPSRVDKTAAPEGKDSLVVLVPVGHLLPGTDNKVNNPGKGNHASQDWPAMVNKARAQIIDILEERLGVTGFKDMITWEDVNTPLTWKEKFNLTHGSILGITHDFFNVLYFRQPARHPTVKSAYFVGASAHPGTGVPIAIAGSKLCAETIFADLSIPKPASYKRAPHQATPSSLDVLQRRPLYFTLEKYLAAIMPYLVGAAFAFIAASVFAWTKGYSLLDGPKIVYINKGVVKGLGLGGNVTGNGIAGSGVGVLDTLNIGEVASPVVIAGLAGLALVSVLYARS